MEPITKPAGRCEIMYWPLFQCSIKISVGKGDSSGYAQECTSQLLNLEPQVLDQLLRASICFFHDVESCQGEPIAMEYEFEGLEYPTNLDVPKHILPYIKPVEAYVDEEAMEFHSVSLFAECAWEPNHGLQWVVRDGKALYVGGFDGLGSHCDKEVYLFNWKDSNYLMRQ